VFLNLVTYLTCCTVCVDKWECAQVLVEHGVDLNPTDCHFGTPLHAAVFKGSMNCVRVLLKAGTHTYIQGCTAVLSYCL